jgi:hypothetical protein
VHLLQSFTAISTSFAATATLGPPFTTAIATATFTTAIATTITTASISTTASEVTAMPITACAP